MNKRYALYLIIYAPRRGLLEVWGCQQGIRVAAFNVGKNSKLIYPGYFMLTLNGSLCNQSLKSSQNQCFLIDESGTIKILQIPFHLILRFKPLKFFIKKNLAKIQFQIILVIKAINECGIQFY